MAISLRWAHRALEFLSSGVDDDELVLGEQPFVTSCLCAQDVAIGQANREVSVHGNQEVAFVAEMREPQKVVLEVPLGFHRCSRALRRPETL